MRYTLLLATLLFLSACEGEATNEHVSNTDSATADSIKRQEIEDEMSKEIIEGAFHALNR